MVKITTHSNFDRTFLQKSPDTPGSPEGNTEVPGTASSVLLTAKNFLHQSPSQGEASVVSRSKAWVLPSTSYPSTSSDFLVFNSLVSARTMFHDGEPWAPGWTRVGEGDPWSSDVCSSDLGGEKGFRGSGAGTLGVPLGGTRCVGGYWGSQESCQGPFRPSGRNRGLPLRRRGGQGPHLAKRWEPRGFFELRRDFSSYDGDLSLPLGLALGSPIFPSGCEGKLGVALESPQGRRDLT